MGAGKAIRLDDVGACSKRDECWSRHRWARVWPLTDRRLFGAWGPYRELRATELEEIIHRFDLTRQVLTVAVTPYWVESDGTLTPYAVRYPGQAAVLRWAVARGTVRLAAHGVTHCQLGRHRPRWIGGNRQWHREPTADRARARHALATYLGCPVERYVAPGEAPTTDEVVFHDRDFVLDWRGAMRRLREVLDA